MTTSGIYQRAEMDPSKVHRLPGQESTPVAFIARVFVQECR
jgi:hypothetical protein